MSNEELRDTCIKIQQATGLDDRAWKIHFGNDEGLYGLFKQKQLEVLNPLLDLPELPVRHYKAICDVIASVRGE